MISEQSEPEQMKFRWLRRLEWLVLSLSGVFFTAGIGLFAAAGRYTRYWADDYCYSAWVKFYGLPGAILDWYQSSGNRLSTLVMVAAGEVFGPRAITWTPLAVLALLAAAWVWFLWRAARWLRWPGGALRWGWLAVVQVYFLALLAPDRLQTIYWRMGTLHYTLPLALLLINLGVALWALHGLRQGWRWLPAVGAPLVAALLAFFAAGLSETYAALQAGLFALGLAAAAWAAFFRLPGKNDRLRWSGLALTGAPLLGTLVMMAIMASAPANAWRQAAMPPPDNLLLVIPYALRYALDFILAELRSRLAPFGLLIVISGAFSLLARLGRPHIQVRAAGLGLTGSLMVTYGLVVCSFAPSAYAGLLYPAPRAQMPALFILLAGLAVSAAFGVEALRGLWPRWGQRLVPVSIPRDGLMVAVQVAVLALLVAISLYPLRMAAIPRQEMTVLAARAARWDERDAQIRAALAGGVQDVVVRQVEVVQSLEDLGPDPAFWINGCAALYYGVGTITANP